MPGLPLPTPKPKGAPEAKPPAVTARAAQKAPAAPPKPSPAAPGLPPKPGGLAGKTTSPVGKPAQTLKLPGKGSGTAPTLPRGGSPTGFSQNLIGHPSGQTPAPGHAGLAGGAGQGGTAPAAGQVGPIGDGPQMDGDQSSTTTFPDGTTMNGYTDENGVTHITYRSPDGTIHDIRYYKDGRKEEWYRYPDGTETHYGPTPPPPPPQPPEPPMSVHNIPR